MDVLREQKLRREQRRPYRPMLCVALPCGDCLLETGSFASLGDSDEAWARRPAILVFTSHVKANRVAHRYRDAFAAALIGAESLKESA